MPYKSAAQRGKFHVLLKQGKISPETVHEFDEASKGMKLPEHDSEERNNPLKETRRPRHRKEK